MTVKREVLEKLGLEELIGTFFEDAMTIAEYPAGDEVIGVDCTQAGAGYIYEGIAEGALYSSEGRMFYWYYEEGDIIGIGESFLDASESEMLMTYGMDLRVQRDMVVVYLPFKEIFAREFSDKSMVLEKLIKIVVREKSRQLTYCTGRTMYSDEEFIIKAFEYKRFFDIPTQDLARGMNINLRNLQRYLKKLEELQVLKREGNKISIGDEEKFNEYKKRFMK